jgi:hypothetical protein
MEGYKMFSSGSMSLINGFGSNSWLALQSEINSTLLTLKGDIQKQAWWQNKWDFKQVTDGEAIDIYMSRLNWVTEKKDYRIWIGTDYFTPETLFTDSPVESYLFIWASKKEYIDDLQQVQQQLVQSNRIKYGLNWNGKNNYLVKSPVQKYSSNQGSDPQKWLHDTVFNFMNYFGSVL